MIWLMIIVALIAVAAAALALLEVRAQIRDLDQR